MGGYSQISPWVISAVRTRSRSLWAALASVVIAGAVFWIAVPEPVFSVPYSSVLFDRDGRLMGARTADDEQLRFPPARHLPEKYTIALVEFEDRRFYYHPGVDPLALMRAMYRNALVGHVVSGGSTITMQAVRLARGNPPRTYMEKIREAFLALRLEMSRSKREILALYAAHAPFGGNIVGIEAASWRYFGRAPEELTWAESALLAVLPNSPSLIHPGRNRQALKLKRDRLLERLSGRGLLSELDLELARMEPLPEVPHDMPSVAPHLLDTFRSGGLEGAIVSSISGRLQKAATSVVSARSQKLCSQKVCNAAAIIIDNKSFEVLAYVGNSRYDNDPARGYSIDLLHRPRSSGSILKPFLYAGMLDAGEILPTTLVPDVPTRYEGYQPENYDRAYRGAVPAREALAMSLNVPAVRMLRQYGVGRFYDFLTHMGMSTLNRAPDDYGLTLVLGGAEVTLWDLASMYANLAAIARDKPAGAHSEWRDLRVITGSAQPAPHRLAEVSRGAAWLTHMALLEVVRPGDEGRWQSFSSARKIAWKTGTSYGLRDAWAVGSTTRYTVGVWVGNADGVGVTGLTGASMAAPILFDMFNFLESAPWFEIPYDSLAQVEVCANDGFLANADCEAARQWAPRGTHFEKVSKYNRRVHLDRSHKWQVHGGCEPVADIASMGWFVLPPAQEYFYRKQNPSYRPLPGFRDDCLSDTTLTGSQRVIDLLYPAKGTQIYIPVDLDGKRGEVVFEAVHREPETPVYWHMDRDYLGQTRLFHQMALRPEPGRHLLILVDEKGNRLERAFTVLSKDGNAAAPDVDHDGN